MNDMYGHHIEHFHCMAHRLELVVDDALKAVTSTNHFQSFIAALHSLYSQSTKCENELRAAAVETETQLLRIKGIFTVRWVASSFRAVRAVWKDFVALTAHFEYASKDSGRSRSERRKFVGLKSKLTSVNFLRDLAMMKDVLREISALSLMLQRRHISVTEAVSAVDSTLRILTTLKQHDGQSTRKLNASLNSSSENETPIFKGTTLENEGKAGINKMQFVQAVLDAMKQRFGEHSRQFVQELSVLDPTSWPTDDTRLVYGDDEVLRLCKKHGLSSRTVLEQ